MNSKSPAVLKNISKFLIEAFDRRNTILAKILVYPYSLLLSFLW